MRSIDTQQSHGALGKPVRAPEPEAKPDEWEFKVSHGTPVYRNKRTGQLQTNAPTPILPPVSDPFKHMHEILKRARETQEDDGFEMNFWGAM